MDRPTRSAGGTADLETLNDALTDANIPSLLLALVHLTGNRKWLESPWAPQRARGLDDNDSGGLPDAVQAEIRAAALAAYDEWRSGRIKPVDLSPDEIATMLGVGLTEPVPAEYGPLLAEELGMATRDVEIRDVREDFQVLIIGSGISGICAAIKLKQAGVPFTIIEKNDRVGGTWLENTYPGCGVDTPAHLYSFAFDPNLEWTRYFAKRGEVWAYLERLAKDNGIHEHIHFGHEVATAEYDAAGARWVVTTRDRDGAEVQFEGDVLVPAVGMVNRPMVPAIPGLDTFAGPSMHTAAWDETVDLTGKRVVVIGTGASAMQLVPSIAGTAGHVTVFQRSKQWAVPHPNYQRNVSERVRTLMENFPSYAGWYRLRAFWNFSDRLHPQVQVDPEWPHKDRSVNAANERHRVFLTEYIERQLADRPELITDCLPDYPPYGKRPLIDNGWFTTIKRDDVDLVTTDIQEVTPAGVLAVDGTLHEADVLVLATGFRVLQFLWPMEIRGADGRSLAEVWGPSDARAHLGLTVPGFPNMFILNGPNTNAGHGGSAIIATEIQVRYFMQALGILASGEADSMEIREDVFWKYNEELDGALAQSIWAHPGMTTYYRNDAGRVVVSSPWTYLDYWRRTLSLDPTDFHLSQKDTVSR